MKIHRILPPILLFISTTSMPVFAAAELKGSPEELVPYLTALPQIVSLTGEGEVKVPADKAEVTLKILTESKSLQDSLRLNQEIRTRLTTFLKENGFGSNQIQAAKFSSTQKYGIFSEKAKSHRVDNFLRITVRDEKEFQTVAGTVDRFSEVHFLGMEVQHTGKDALKARAEAQAIDKATERRKLFEEKLGVKLVAKRFAEATMVAGASNVRSSYYGLGYPASSEGAASGAGGLFRKGLDKTTTIPGAASDESDSPFGELIFTARVTIDYAVESGPPSR